MSDRSGVGAPTHDGAEPEKSGSGEPADGGSDAPRRRRAAGLLEAAFGADAPAGRRPPGVPAGPPSDGGDRPARTSSAPNAETAAAATTAPAKAPAKTAPAKKATGKKKAATTPARTAAGRTAPASASTAATTPHAQATTATPVVERGRRSASEAPVVDERPAPSRPTADPRDRAPRRGPLRARQVHRIVRRVDPWSMLKLSLVFYFCVWLMVMISGVLIWGVAVGSGTVEGVEGFIARLLAFEEFRFNADQIFRLFAMGGLILVFLATAVSAILAVLFNLISDLIGGIRVTVIEEETTRRIVREQ